jgi:hypothetical protein
MAYAEASIFTELHVILLGLQEFQH